jgi:oligoribonuclease
MLELGIRITDLELNAIDEKQFVFWGPQHYVQYNLLEHSGLDSDKWVRKQHTKSGLFEEARNYGTPYLPVQEQIVDWLEKMFKTFDAGKLSDAPLCGSSVHFDRGVLHQWMRELVEMFHHRNIDISTLKELCKRLNPELYKKQNIIPRKKHRVLPDLDDTIEEARWYFDEFLFF